MTQSKSFPPFPPFFPNFSLALHVDSNSIVLVILIVIRVNEIESQQNLTNVLFFYCTRSNSSSLNGMFLLYTWQGGAYQGSLIYESQIYN